MIVSTFFVLNKDSKKKFFEKSFLLTNIKPDIIFEMLFLIMSKIDIDFQAWNL